MKNWKYIEGAKTGNADLSAISKNWSKTEIDHILQNAHVFKKEVVEEAKRLKEAEKNKTGNDTPWEYAHRKPKVINDDKTGAEEFFKQLSDDVKEREDKDDADIEKVGNKTYKVKESSGHDGGYDYGYIVVDESNRSVGRTFSTRSEAEEYIRGLYKKEKVGNASVSGGTFKSDDGSQKAVIDVNPQSGTARVVWFENDRQNASSDYRSIDLATAAVKRKGLKKVGNFKTGTSQLKPGDKVMSFGKKGTVKEVIGENTDNIYGEPLIKVEFEDGTTKTIGEHYMRKVGNARYTTREDVISHLDTDLYDICKKVPAGSPSFAYVSELQKKGWDISTISKYSKEIGKIIDQYKVGNSKIGNAKDKNGKDLRVGDIVLVWTSAGERAGKVKEVSGDRITVAIRNEGDWSTPGKLADKVSNSKARNEAPDDKFAYVMREFDAGKLKTPDGKVVTDPAQAKAIAYSESKKTENGLARARNAMAKNKKVGNHDFEEGDYVLYNGKKAVVRGFNGSQEVIIEQNGQRITTHWSNLEEYE